MSVGDGVIGGDEHALVEYGCEEDGETGCQVGGEGEVWMKSITFPLSTSTFG